MTQKTLSDETFRHILHEQIIKLCHSFELPLHWNKIGPKKFTNYQRAGIIVLFLRSKKSLRDFIRELKESRWTSWLGLKSLPGKSTLHDWQTIFDLKTLRLFQEILLCKEKPSLMAIDATGIDSWQRSRHYERRMIALRSKEPHMKKREIAWHILIYNLEILQRIRQFILWLLKEPFRTSLISFLALSKELYLTSFFQEGAFVLCSETLLVSIHQ